MSRALWIKLCINQVPCYKKGRVLFHGWVSSECSMKCQTLCINKWSVNKKNKWHFCGKINYQVKENGTCIYKGSKWLGQSFFLNNYKTYVYLTKFRLLQGIKVRIYILMMNLYASLHFVEIYDFDQQVVVCKSLRDTSSRLAELGWLHNKVRKYTDARSLDRAFGLVGQVCFCVYALPIILCFFLHQLFKNMFSSSLRVFVLHCIRSWKSTTGYCLSCTLRYTTFYDWITKQCLQNKAMVLQIPSYRTAVWRKIYSVYLGETELHPCCSCRWKMTRAWACAQIVVLLSEGFWFGCTTPKSDWKHWLRWWTSAKVGSVILTVRKLMYFNVLD